MAGFPARGVRLDPFLGKTGVTTRSRCPHYHPGGGDAGSCLPAGMARCDALASGRWRRSCCVDASTATTWRISSWSRDRRRPLSAHLLLAAPSSEGLLTEPTAAAQPGRQEPLFMPQSRRPSSGSQIGGVGWNADVRPRAVPRVAIAILYFGPDVPVARGGAQEL